MTFLSALVAFAVLYNSLIVKAAPADIVSPVLGTIIGRAMNPVTGVESEIVEAP